MRFARSACVLLLSLVVGCGETREPTDARAEDDAGTDASALDAWTAPDAWNVPDAWAPDAWRAPDAWPCGNGATDPGEACDDGNQVSGDGCRADCRGREVCGDGLVDVGELCLPTIPTSTMATVAAGGVGQAFAADADRDGDLDVFRFVVTADAMFRTRDAILLYANDGAGTLGPQLDTGADVSLVSASQLADLDGDGRPDVLSTAVDNVFVSYLNDGSGSFSSAPSYVTMPASVCSVASGDFDGDGDVDAVAAMTSQNALQFLMNDGHGVLSLGPTLATATAPCSIVVARFDANTTLDLVVASTSGASLHRGLGLAVFGPAEHVDTPAWATAAGVFSGDVDGDGDLDVLSTTNAGDVVVLQNDYGALGAVASAALGVAIQQAADFDGDALVDLVTSNPMVGSARRTSGVRLGDGLGGFGPELWSGGMESLSAHAANLNGDGALDMVVGRQTSLDVFLADP